MLFNKQQIKEIIPYDSPFLWVDEIDQIQGNLIIGFKQTFKDDPYFKGHFVDFPIMPGVLMIEGLAQTGSLLLRQQVKDHKNKHFLAYQVRSVFFYKPTFPGDKIRYKVQLLGFHDSKIANFLGEAFVGEDRKCEARFSLAVVDKKDFGN